MLFSDNKCDGKLLLLLDIGSSMIRGSLMQICLKGSPVVIFSEEIAIPFKLNSNSSHLIHITLKTVGSMLDSVLSYIHLNHKNGAFPGKISEIYYVLSSPWIISQAKSLAFTFPKPTRITKEVVLNIIGRERDKFAKQGGDDLLVIEEKIFDVRLNGYSVESWKDKEATQIAVSYVVSIAGIKMIDLFMKTVKRIVPERKVSFHSSILLQHVGIGQIKPTKQDYMLIHVHGELTDVAIIRQESCTFFGSYPVGIKTIIRKIANTTKSNIDTVDSLISMYAEKSLDEMHSKSLIKVIEEISQGWLAELSELLKTSTEETGRYIPDHLILSSTSHDRFFAKCYKEKNPSSKIELITNEDLDKHVKYGHHTEHTTLTGIYAVAVDHLLK